MTENELLLLVSHGVAKSALVVVSVTKPGSWHLTVDLANGEAIAVNTARGEPKNYSLDAVVSLLHRIGVERFTVGLRGTLQSRPAGAAGRASAAHQRAPPPRECLGREASGCLSINNLHEPVRGL